MKLLLIMVLFYMMPGKGSEKSALKTDVKNDKATCGPLDFLKLKEKGLRDNFFAQLDSIRKVQHPNNDQESKIMIDLNLKLLARFLKDIDQKRLSKTGSFEKEYHFNIAPEGYSDPEKCKDKISVQFDPKDCRYRLVIWNTFLVETDWCTESQVSYFFEIKRDKITGFWRSEVG